MVQEEGGLLTFFHARDKNSFEAVYSPLGRTEDCVQVKPHKWLKEIRVLALV